MARAGILYSHVAQAAARLAAEGKNPTVDTVREALGDTGSKSTIAPFLKRWKTEHQETILEADLGVPAELLLAVKSVYEKMQADVNVQLEQVQATHQTEMQAAAEQVQQAKTEAVAHGKSNAELRAELERTSAAFTRLQVDHHAATVTLSAVQAENTGLNQRLADRATEINALNQQLSQARTQFEHYQEATARQRTEDRQAADQRIARLEQELADTQRRLATEQAASAQQHAQIVHLNTDRDRLQQAVSDAQDALGVVRTQRDQLAYQVKELATVRVDLDKKLDAAQEALTEARVAAATAQKDADMHAERLTNAEEKIAKLDQERVELMQKLKEREIQIGELSRAKVGS